MIHMGESLIPAPAPTRRRDVKNAHYAFMFGVAWLSFVTGSAYEMVGDMPTCEVFTWELVPIVLIFTGFTFPCGWIAGKYWEV